MKLIQHLSLATARATCSDGDWLDDAQEHLSLALVELQKLRDPNDLMNGVVAKALDLTKAGA
jgi:hypothetical protein